MRKLVLIIFAVLFASLSMMGQNLRITGTVTDEEGKPVSGVTVVVKDTHVGTITGETGKYSIEASRSAVLVFSFVGMQSQEVAVGGKRVVDVVMKSESQKMDDVVVVAYGTAKKETFTGSVGTVKSTDIAKRNSASVSKSLEGTVAGIQTTSGGGQPGSDAAIRIRGFGSLSASNAPLYVVDGIPYDGYISAINPNDIESISILKDASASALYGARGANGVVMITTKRGKEGETKINLKADFGLSRRALDNYETVSVPQYMEMARELYGNNFMSQLGGEAYNPYNIASTDLFDENGKVRSDAKLKWTDNWFDEAERKNALRQEYQVSVNGGTTKTQYMMSLGYLKEEGLAKSTDFSRISGNLNVDTQIKEWLKGGLSFLASNTKQNSLLDGGTYYTNVWYSALNLAPIYPVYVKNSDGSNKVDASGKPIFDYGDTRPLGSNSNAIGDLYYNNRIGKNDNLSGRAYFTLDTDKDIAVIKDLALTLNFGFDYYSRNRSVYSNPTYGQYASAGGQVYKYGYRNMSYTFNQLLTYKKSFGRSNIDVLAGHEYYDMDYYAMVAGKKGFAFPGLYELSAASTITDAESQTDTYRIESYLSRLNYDFDGKYYFSASFRTDGSSRFHADSRWGKFWSVGASWRMSSENFMKDIKWLDNATLKVSYGSQGNDNLSSTDDERYYAWQGLYDLAYPNANNGGVWSVSLPNENLKWEKNHNLNIGFEAAVFDRRLSVEAEYYIKKTDDLLMERPLSTSLGYNYYLDNVGSMENKGVDITLSGVPIRNKDFRWNVSLMMSHVKNKVTRLNDGLQNLAPTSAYITKVGYPVNSFYLVFNGGVDPETGVQLYKYYDADGKIQTTEDYSTASANRTDANISGSRIPDLYGSFTNSFTYKGFDLSFMFTYSLGGKVIDGTYLTLMESRSAGSNYHKDLYEKRWKNPGDITDVPALSQGQKYFTDFYLTNASYLCLKNLTFGYTFAQTALKKAGIDGIRLSVTANNLYTWSHRKGMDPQYSFNGTVDYTYVPIKNVSFGVDIKF